MSQIRIYAGILFAVFMLCLLAACETDSRKTGKRLYLPEGDIEAGKTAFIELGCYACHTVAGEDLPVEKLDSPLISLELGGKIRQVKTYGELITSIINPDHIMSPEYAKTLDEHAKAGRIESPMPSFNDRMTVSQLIDLVWFLDSRYEKLAPVYTGYRYGMVW